VSDLVHLFGKRRKEKVRWRQIEKPPRYVHGRKTVPAYNLHARRLNATQEEKEVGAFIDSLAGDHDRLWANHSWPEMRIERPLSVGAVGGHGPIEPETTEQGRKETEE
jgi:hypothetical protein